MDYVETSTWLTISLIVGSILVSGPLVPSLDLASQPIQSTDNAVASGASVSIVSPPTGQFRIDSGRFGGGPFLYVPSVSVRVDAVRGDPILIYEIAVQGLGFNAAELVFLSATDAGREKIIEIDRPTVDQDSITEQAYDAVVSVRLRTQGETSVLFRKKVTVIVEDSDDD